MPNATRWHIACCILLLAANVAAQEAEPVSPFAPEFESADEETGAHRFSPATTEFALPRCADRGESDLWCFQFLPDGVLYRSYLAGGKEPRMGVQCVYESDLGWLLDFTIGGRVGLLRYGTWDTDWPEGYQLDVEGAAFPRLNLDSERDLVSADFRAGVPLTYRSGPWELKFAYYHLSSHLGDEYMLKHPDVSRINYSRDTLVLGTAWWLNDNVRFYAEAGWAFWADEGSDPWEFQFGMDYSPAHRNCIHGAPFFAINGRIREDVDFGGSLTVQAGWQWRADASGLVRTGFYYFNGKSDQYEFVQEHEELVGLGLWYDF